MAYCTRADIEQRYGAHNLRAWSNLDGDADQVDDQRVQAAIDHAAAEIDHHLRGGPYPLPLRSADGRTPAVVNHLAARLAAAFLREAHLPSAGDEDPSAADAVRRDVARQLLRIRAGALALDARRHAPAVPHVTSPGPERNHG